MLCHCAVHCATSCTTNVETRVRKKGGKKKWQESNFANPDQTVFAFVGPLGGLFRA